MVDINYILLVQLVNFGLLIIILNSLLLKPVLKHLSERDNKISSSHDDARANAEKAEEMLAGFERELAEARLSSSQRFSKLQDEGLSAQRARLGEARSKAQELLEEARGEIEKDAARAREILQLEMEKLHKDIASKLLGRSI